MRDLLTKYCTIDDKVFNLEFDGNLEDDQIGISTKNKQFLYEMNEFPNICTIRAFKNDRKY